MPISVPVRMLNPKRIVHFSNAILAHGFLRLCTTPFLGARAVDASTHMSDTPTMARLASVPMISRTFILPPNDYEYDGEGDCAKKHPT